MFFNIIIGLLININIIVQSEELELKYSAILYNNIEENGHSTELLEKFKDMLKTKYPVSIRMPRLVLDRLL